MSAVLVITATLPALSVATPKPFIQRLTAGVRLFALTPRLRGLLAISLATAAGGAMVFVNTVVLVRSSFGLGDRETAWALGAFGLGSISAAVLLSRLASSLGDRTAMLTGSVVMGAALLAGPFLATSYPVLLGLWVVIGFGYSLTITPSGRTLRRSAHAEDRPALFAAQFALSHACWLLAYPLAGFIGSKAGISASFLAMAVLCLAGAILAVLIWPARDPAELLHSHPDLAPDDPHWADTQGGAHVHAYVIDDRHRRWPSVASRYPRP
jgi:predicted MFS family arabinose efflux permease